MSANDDSYVEDLQKLRAALLRDESRRVRIAAWGLFVIAIAVLLFFAFSIWAGLTEKGPAWSLVALLGLAAGLLAVPLIAKFNVSKDGGSIDFVSPTELIDRLERRAQAARIESFEQTRQQISGLSQQVEELANALEAIKAIPADRTTDNAHRSAFSAEPTLREVRHKLKQVTDNEDQQKGRFGGSESSGGRRIKAEVSNSEFGKKWQKVILTLISENGEPLTGAYAYFFLHETFDPDTYRVKVPIGASQVSFETAAIGAFTAGVAAERGRTLLEIDLATSPNVDAPNWWKNL